MGLPGLRVSSHSPLARAPRSSSQKWSKGKMKEKVNNQVLFDKV